MEFDYPPLQCPSGKNIPYVKLPSPPNCSAGRALRLRDIQNEFTGPWINTTVTLMPPDLKIDKKHLAGLAAMETPIPKKWSWREQGGNMIEPARNQGNCGNCWAFATASVLGDRYALKYKIASPKPSVTWLTSCGLPKGITTNQECLCGGNTYLAGKWLESNELKLESCWPFSFISNSNYTAPPCLKELPDNCCYSCCSDDNKDAKVKFSVLPNSTKYVVVEKNNEAVPEATTQAIQREIMTYGPVTASFQVPDNFQSWWSSRADTGEVYIPNAPLNGGGHAVVLSGWGEKDGVRYWELRNSWGDSGDRGYCKFAFSLDTPKEYWTDIDIPRWQGGWNGGVVSFQPGPLNSEKKFEKGDKDIVVQPWKDTQRKLNIDWRVVVVIAVIILLIILILSI